MSSAHGPNALSVSVEDIFRPMKGVDSLQGRSEPTQGVAGPMSISENGKKGSEFDEEV